MNWFKRAFSLLVALIVVMIAVSCTTERDAVDKTDELALDKRLFEGEFFLRQTIVDIPYTVDYSFIGESNDGKVVKWKITKNWLIAYSVWDKLNSIDTNEIVDVNETPVVAFPIAMHYDIVPTENPTTGEALPVLTPNMDRPWNERRYFSLAYNTQSGVNSFEYKYMNLTMEWGAPFYRYGIDTATDWEFYAHDGTFIVPKKYREYTAIADDKARVAKEVQWFQFYSTEYLAPRNNWGSIYSWEDIEEFIGSEPAGMTHRYVFTKVNRDVVGKRDYDVATRSFLWKKGSKDNGFRPLEFQDELFREYGYFTNTFRGYDNYHGYKDDNFHVLANYWNTAWANEKKEWNFKCSKGESYNDCLKKLKFQQKLVFVSSPKTPLRMIPVNCAITKDYNHAMLASRYAAMNPGSDVRKFEKWYAENYKNDFFKEVNGQTVRDLYWYLNELPSDWEEKCFVPDEYAWIQNWDGSFINESEDGSINEDMEKALLDYKNDMVVMVKNNVEAYLPLRDGKSLYGFGNYYNYSDSSRENAARICVKSEEAAKYREDQAMQFSTCVTNDEEMSKLYLSDGGNPEWRGDRWSCKVYDEGDKCPEGTVEAKAACVLTVERTCKMEGGLPVLRYKYDNGNPRAALMNWVEKPTEFGILGVAQWNVNPETGMSMGGGANVAGSVLAWATERAVEMARMVISKDDPAAWDFEDLVNPDYAKYPEVAWNNNPKTYEGKSVAKMGLKNSMKMINKPLPTLEINAPIESQTTTLKEYNDLFQSTTRKYDRFDFSAIKDTKWESKMVPYSIKRALFPWNDPADNPSYTDAENEIMEPWYSGPALMEAQMLRWMDAKARDFDYDESFLDGTIINFIIAKQKELRGQIGDWDKPSGASKYEKALIYAIYDELEKLMYKGVAQHEMGHVVGLRHNFAGSTDINNFGDGYFAERNFPAMMDGVETLVKEEVAKPNYNPGLLGDKVYRFKKEFDSDINYFTYNSVMDYQREAYIHANGLGKYDLAALKFVYGRSIEQYMVEGGNKYGLVVKEGDENDPNPELVNKLRDPRFPDFVKVNAAFIDDKTGKLARVEKPRQVVEYYDENGEKITRMVPRYDRTLIGNFIINDSGEYKWQHDCDATDPAQTYCEGGKTLLVNDGSHYEYIFVSDEKSYDDPKANTFDGGYLASDVIRHMVDMDDMFYYLRFFRRGNPKFREFRGRTSMKMIYDSLFREYKLVHFLLDYNFYAYGKWFPHMPLWSSPDGCSTYKIAIDEESIINVPDHLCQEHSRALTGEEYWVDPVTQKVRGMTPMGPGDHVLAGMEGIQYLLFERIYKPSAGEYMKVRDDAAAGSKLAPEQTFYYQSTDNYIDGISSDPAPFGISPSDFMRVPASMGRYHRDRYDIQDNPGIYYDKVIRRGFAEEKMVSLFTLSNSGWFDGKYRRESRANGLSNQFDGLELVIFNVLSDIATEEALMTFSPYCVDSADSDLGAVKAQYPANLLTNFGALPNFWPGESSLEGSYEPVPNICSMIDPSDPGKYVPLHAGWIYFDKMWPNYWAMGNMANISADTSVLRRWVSGVIPVYEIDLYPSPDVNEAQFLSQDENVYYRAQIPVSAMDNIDKMGFRAWRDCRDQRIKNDIEDFSPCVLEVIWPDWYLTEVITSNNPTWNATQIAAELQRIKDEGEHVRFASEAEFKKFLGDKYARYSPAYRIVRDAKILKDNEIEEASSGSREPFSRLVIMETTLDQLNSFAQDQFGTAAFYVQYY